MALEKDYLNGNGFCRVTFRLPWESAEFATNVHVVGEFNRWNIHATPMTRLRDGAFEVSVDLKRNKEYQFRYLVDFYKWENDWHADKYVPSPYEDTMNSVVVL